MTLIGGIVLVTLGAKEIKGDKPKKERKYSKPAEKVEKEQKEEIIDAEEIK